MEDFECKSNSNVVMSRNDSVDLPKVDKESVNYNYYQQLGAPALIYEGNRGNGFDFPIPSQNLPKDKSRELHDKFKRRNRVRARWEYGLDVNQIETVVVPHLLQRGKDKGNPKTLESEDTRSHSENLVDENNEEKGEAIKILFDLIKDLKYIYKTLFYFFSTLTSQFSKIMLFIISFFLSFPLIFVKVRR